MAKEAGIIKVIQGKVHALNALTGESRELHEGDALYQGEKVITEGADTKVVMSQPDGKELTLLGNDTLTLDGSATTGEKISDEASVADVSALQKALLNGTDLSGLEETAAGGNTAAGGGDGVSLSEARFAEGGHYSNISETYRNLSDTNRAFASYDNPVGGYRDGNDGDDTIIPSAPTVKFVNDINGNHTLSRVEHKDDTDINTSKVLITVPNDGTVRAGDVLKVTVTDPNGNETTTNVTITPAIITNGYPINAPVEPGKNSKVEASVTNFQGNTSGSSEDHVTPTKSSVSVEFTEDTNNDHFLSYTENFDKNASPHDLNTSPVKITATDVIPGDILHIEVTKPGNTIPEIINVPIPVGITNNTFTYEIPNMPVVEGKVSKVDAYVTDSSNSNTWKSDIATDNVTPDIRPTLTFTEDGDNNGFLADAENKGTDGNFRTSPVEITLPKDVVAGDKIVITYTDPLNPTGPKKDLKIDLTDEMIINHKVTGIELPIFPGVETKASVHVETHDGIQKSEESAKDSATPQTIKMDMDLPEQQTLHEISRQESVSNYKKTYNGEEIDLGDQKVNHTTAKITLPNRIDDGDKLTLTVTKPDGNTYDRNFTIHMNEKGVITSVDEVDNAGHVIGKYDTAHKNFFKEDTNQWAIKVDGFELENGKDTKIEAKVTHPANANLPTEVDIESARLEHVKKPEVIFEEAGGAKTMTREQAISDHDLNNTTVTIKLPKNAVNGDKINVTIKNPDGTTQYKHYTVEKDATGKLTGITNNDNASDHVTIKNGNSFEIPGIKTATGVKTEVTAEIVDSDGSIQHAQNSSSVMIAGLNDMAVRFVEDSDHNVSLTRAESMKDGNLKETTIAVKVPNNVIAGDMVNVTINGTSLKTYKVTGRDEHGKITLEDISTHASITASDKNEIEIPGVEIIAGKTINVTAETTDASGGKKAEAQNHNTLEKLHDDMKITFDADKHHGADGILDNTEATGKTTMTTIKLPSNFVDGDKLIIETSNNSSPDKYTIHKDSNGVVTVTNDNGGADLTVNGNAVKYPLTNLQNGEETTITAKVTGAAGDVSETKSNIMLDTGAGTGTKFRLLIDEDDDRNGVLSREEAMEDGHLKTTSATLQIPTDVTVGDTIVVSVNGGTPKEYKVVSNNGTNVTIEDAKTHASVALEPGNKLKISDVHLEKHPGKEDYSATVEATINGVTKTAEAKLETFDATNLKVEFKEDDASRDGKIDRDESVSVDGVKVTTISVQVPYNVISGDKVSVTINEPQADGTTSPKPFNYTVSKVNGKISLIDDSDPTHTPHELKNNTFEISGVEMLPGRDTTATATITNATGDMSATSEEAKAQLAPLSEAGLSVSIADDKNDDGVISRDESGSNTSKVKVSIPASVIKGDKIDVEITNPDNSKVTKHYEVDDKNVNGDITLKEVVGSTTTYTQVSANHPLELDAAIAVGKDTVAKVTLTDTFGESVSTTKIDQDGNEIDVKAHAEIDAMRGIMFNKDIHTLESGEKTTTAKFFLNEDAREGDKVEIKYTDPNDHSQTKTTEYEIKPGDISKGFFEHSLDIDTRSRAGYDLKVEATLKTQGHLQSETYETDQSFHINAGSYTIKYDANKTIEGGDSNNDTLVVGDGQTIDFSHVRNIEKLDIKNGEKTTLSLSADDIKDMLRDSTENKLKLDGDSNDEVTLTGGNWSKGASTPDGYTSYSDGTTTIEIKDQVHVDI